MKGAPKEVLSLCTHLQLRGQTCALDDEQRARVITANDNYARAGLRVLAVAQRVLSDTPPTRTPETVERDLTLLGLIAMLDPPRAEVAEAVDKCHRAGIRLIMMTGDYGLTAESIATELGLLLFLVYVPLLQRLFGTAAFPLHYWVFLFAWMPLLFLADEGRKALVRGRAAR